MLAFDEVLGSGDKLVVASLHALLGERPGVRNLLLAHSAPARFFGRIISVGRPGVNDAARPKSLLEVGEILLRRVIVHLRLFFGIEVIEVAAKLIEAVHGWEILV